MPLPNTIEKLIDNLSGTDTIATIAARNGFKFGAATGGTIRLADTEYMSFCLEQSNCLTGLSGFYPGNLQPSQGVFDFTNANGLIALRGGRPIAAPFMVYHAVTPTWMSNALNSGTWAQLIDDHIAGISVLSPGLESWMVTNETIAPDGSGYRNTIWNQAAGGAWIPYAFQRARAYNPTAKLFLCESDLEPDYSGNKATAFLALVDTLMATTQGGLPVLDGVCLQGHLHPTDYAFTGTRLASTLRSLITDRGLEVRITEFDVRNDLYTDMGAFDVVAAEATKVMFNVALDAGVRWFTTWDIRNDYSWLTGLQPSFTQRGLPFLADGRPSQIERAIRAALT